MRTSEQFQEALKGQTPGELVPLLSEMLEALLFWETEYKALVEAYNRDIQDAYDRLNKIQDAMEGY